MNPLPNALRAPVRAAALVLAGLALATSAHAREVFDDFSEHVHEWDDGYAIHVMHVQGNVYMLADGEGANITVQLGQQGVLLVDTGNGTRSERILEAIDALADGRVIRNIINTTAHPEFSGGNDEISAAGRMVIGANVTGLLEGVGSRAAILAHENVLFTMAVPRGDLPPVDPDARPAETYFTPSTDIHFNGEPVVLSHQPAAYSDGDSIVHFRRSDVVSTGPVFATDRYPPIDEATGSIDGVLDALNNIITITVPRRLQEGGTRVIPGHGRLADEGDVVEYRNVMTIIRDRVSHLMEQGMSLDEVIDARPTREYDSRFETEDWTASMFVTAVYRSLEAQVGAAR